MFKKTKAATVKEYLDQLPDEDRKVLSAVRKIIKKHVPKGYVETLNWGMITYEIPLKRYPNTYNKQPLMFAAIAAQKKHYGLYLMCAYINPETTQGIEDAFKKAGKKLDMGKSCIRFKKLDDLPIEAIGKIISKISVDRFIESYESSRK
jgi:uncharacterized protein YdhG (YjbR/CyaY superfamily)